VVRVLPNGFDFDGTVYRSLSAVATAVTGANWNGYLFFGLTTDAKGPRERDDEATGTRVGQPDPLRGLHTHELRGGP